MTGISNPDFDRAAGSLGGPTSPRIHTQPPPQPEHDPVPSPTPTEPQQEVPDHDPPVFPERSDNRVIFDEDDVAK